MSLNKEYLKRFESLKKQLYKDGRKIYFYILDNIKIIFDDNFPYEAAVSYTGETLEIYINGKMFYNNNTATEQLALLEHEILHIKNNHMQRMEKIIETDGEYFISNGEKDLSVVNIAADLAVNSLMIFKVEKYKNLLPGSFGFPDSKSLEYYYDLIISRNKNKIFKMVGEERNKGRVVEKFFKNDFKSILEKMYYDYLEKENKDCKKKILIALDEKAGMKKLKKIIKILSKTNIILLMKKNKILDIKEIKFDNSNYKLNCNDVVETIKKEKIKIDKIAFVSENKDDLITENVNYLKRKNIEIMEVLL